MSDDMTDFFGEPISVYTRAQAIEDGVLHPVPDHLRRRFGLIIPACIADYCWRAAVADSDPERQEEKLAEFVAAVRDAVGRNKAIESQSFTFTYAVAAESEVTNVEVTVHIGPGDEHEPVLTIMTGPDI